MVIEKGKLVEVPKLKFNPVIFRVTNPLGFKNEFGDKFNSRFWADNMPMGKVTEVDGPDDEVLPPSDWPEENHPNHDHPDLFASKERIEELPKEEIPTELEE